MNNSTILLYLFFGLFIGCQDSTPNEKFIIENEAKNGIIIDTIFLDYRFGMTKKEFISHTKTLISEDRLIVNKGKRAVYYEFNEEYGDELYAEFAPEYHLDSLNELVLSFKSKERISSPELIKLKVANMYLKKYGSPSLEEQNILDKSKNYIWIIGNLKILIGNGLDDARVWYTDLRKEGRVEEHEKSIRLENIEKTKMEI